MTLEDKLIENLVLTYKARGMNVQGIISNPIFKGLPLSDKIRMINKYSKDLSTAPSLSFRGVGSSAIAGGTLALMGSAGRLMMMGKSPSTVNYKLATGLGAGLGAAARLIESKRSLDKDREIASSIGNPYSTIVLNSIQQPSKKPEVAKLQELVSLFGAAKLDADKNPH